MKLLIKILLGAALAAILYFGFSGGRAEWLRKGRIPGLPTQGRLVELIRTNHPSAKATNALPAAPDSEHGARIDRIVDKMAGTLVQLGKPVDVSLSPATKPVIGNSLAEADSSAIKYERLWNKLERNQNAIKE